MLPPMGNLYDQDPVLWSEEQGRALRAAAADPAREWRDTIRGARREVDRRLNDSPSLRREVSDIVADEMTSARLLVRANLQAYGEQPRIDIGSVTCTEAQVIGDWLPENAQRKRSA
jgi:hypothetical protein